MVILLALLNGAVYLPKYINSLFSSSGCGVWLGFFPFISGLDYVFRPTFMHGRKEIQGCGGILTVLSSELHKFSFFLPASSLTLFVSSLLSLRYIASQKEPPAPGRTRP